LLDGLNANQFDVVAAGMFVTPARAQQAAFSRPTFAVRSALLVQKGNPHRLHAYADIVRDASARIAVLTGSVEEKRLLQLGVPAARLVPVPDARAGRILVDSAKIDGLTLSAPTIQWMISQKKVSQAEIAGPFEDAGQPAGQTAFAFRKSDQALRQAWDRELAKFIGSEEHLRLIRQFGFSAADLPSAANRSQNPAS
jgi:polar amino acid transport system substrate-binding protein